MQNGTTYEFSDFRLIPDDGLLLRNDEPIPLPPKAFSTLVLLIERSGHLVNKSELIEKVWSNAFVEEAAVSRCVWTIRNALGGDSKNQQYIQTVPKRGYKFVAPVSVVDDRPSGIQPINGNGNGSVVTVPSSAANSSSVGQPPSESLFGRWLGTRGAVTAAAVLAIAFVAVYAIFFRQPAVANGTSITIAVLPLRAVNADVDDQRFELGIADALILKLSSSKSFEVRSLQAIQGYSDENKDAIEAGREQRVQYVLSSNYQIAEGKIRVTSQLLNVANGLVEDTFKVEKTMTDFFSAQDAVASDIGNGLLAWFAVEPGTVKKRGTLNEDAYRLYLQGMYLSTQRGRGSVVKSIEVLERAVQVDPNYAQAWASIAYVYGIGAMTAANIDRSQAYSKRMEAINRALALDPNLSEAYVALCGVKLNHEYDFAAAETVCKRALELGPDSSRAHMAYGMFLETRGLMDEAIAEFKTSIDLDPTSYETHRFYANTLYFARRYDEAIEQYKRVMDLDPTANPTYNWLIRTLEAQGKESEAFEWFIRSLSVQNGNDAVIQRYTTVYQKSGWPGVLRERIETSGKERSANSFRIAGWYARVGDKDKAFEYLETAYREREGLMAWLRAEAQFDSLHDDPRYDDLVRRMNFK